MKKYLSIFAMLLLGSATTMASCPTTLTLEQVHAIGKGGAIIDGKKFVPIDQTTFNKNLPSGYQFATKWTFSPTLLAGELDKDGILACHYQYKTIAGYKYDLIIMESFDVKTESEAFSLFNLPETATWEKVKKTYKNLSFKLHPDRTGGKTTKEFQRLGSAYDILKKKFGQ